MESYNNGSPSKNDIDALEDSDLFLIEKADFEKLVADIHMLRKVIYSDFTSQSYLFYFIIFKEISSKQSK